MIFKNEEGQEVDVKLSDWEDEDIVAYVIKEKLIDGILDKIEDEDILEQLMEHVEITDILKAIGEEKVLHWINRRGNKVSGHFVIKSENLNQTMAIESFVKKLRTYC